MAGILVENAASLFLHELAGFRRVGVLEHIGRDRTDRWRESSCWRDGPTAKAPADPS